MPVSRTTWIIFVCVLLAMTLSLTVKNPSTSAEPTQQSRRAIKPLSHEDSIKRYPIAEFDEPEPTDAVRKEALRERKIRNNDQTFSEPSAEDGAVGWFPERNFNFPALPVNESDVIVVGKVLSAKAHRSENGRGIFSDFEVTVEEVLKGRSSFSDHNVIVIERTGGYLKYPNGRKVLFFVQGYGMPEVGARNVFFLKVVGQGFRIVTAYELGPDGVLPLDLSRQFERFQGEEETAFIDTLRQAVANAHPH